jgi:hypothetical protein
MSPEEQDPDRTTINRDRAIERLLKAHSHLLRGIRDSLKRLEMNVNSCVLQYHELAGIISGIDGRTSTQGKEIYAIKMELHELLKNGEEPWMEDTPLDDGAESSP